MVLTLIQTCSNIYICSTNVTNRNSSHSTTMIVTNSSSSCSTKMYEQYQNRSEAGVSVVQHYSNSNIKGSSSSSYGGRSSSIGICWSE